LTGNAPALSPRDHGGGIDAAIRRYGGRRGDWLDLSTGINPRPWPVSGLEPQDWTALPDVEATLALNAAARSFWNVPERAEILAAPGASSLIARIPWLTSPGSVQIALRSYNEHAAAFRTAGWDVGESRGKARVVVHPNNPDGRLWDGRDLGDESLLVIDESFCDVTPAQSLVHLATRPGVVVLKSFGKFWGLAGLRLGFAIARPETLGPLAEMLGPWPVSGPALAIGTRALSDDSWARNTRSWLAGMADRLDRLMTGFGARSIGGTTLFRLYEVDNAARWQDRLAQGRVLGRIFPYSETWLRLGIPGDENALRRLEAALAAAT